MPLRGGMKTLSVRELAPFFSNESCAFVGIEHRRAQGGWAGYPNDAIHRDAARNLLGLKTSEESTAVATPSQS